MGAARGLLDAERPERVGPVGVAEDLHVPRAAPAGAVQNSHQLCAALARQSSVVASPGEVLGYVDACDPVDVLRQVQLDFGRVADVTRAK